MTRPRRRSISRGGLRRAALVLLLAVCLLPHAGARALAASKDTRPAAGPLTPTPPPPAAAKPLTASEAATGMCQCIADHDRRHIGCLASVDACQSACGGTHYSFVPHAPSCPITAQGR
jgi:hypothetical protein